MRHTNDVMALLDDRRPTILKDSWTKSAQSSFDENSDPEASILVMKDSDPDSSEIQNKRQGSIKKRVQFCLSDIRRESLTGSLPDLAKAATKNDTKKACPTEQQEQLELNIKREPLPEGSDVFRAVMNEIDSEEGSSTENLTDSLNKSWTCGQRRSKSSLSSSAQKAKFQSKTAAAMYAKMHPLTSSPREKSHVTQRTPQKKSVDSHTGMASPRLLDKRTKSANKSNTGINSSSASGRHHSTSSSSNTKLSPLVSGEVGEIRISSEKIGVRRQLSVTESSRFSTKRPATHKKLTKSSSLDV